MCKFKLATGRKPEDKKYQKKIMKKIKKYISHSSEQTVGWVNEIRRQKAVVTTCHGVGQPKASFSLLTLWMD